MHDTDTLRLYQRDVVQSWLRHAGWWFPPDAIDAVYEGRDTYHPLDSRLSYPTSRVRTPVSHAIEQAQDAGWHPPRHGRL